MMVSNHFGYKAEKHDGYKYIGERSWQYYNDYNDGYSYWLVIMMVTINMLIIVSL